MHNSGTYVVAFNINVIILDFTVDFADISHIIINIIN